MKQQKILVVDDEPDILELVQYNLEKEGFSVRTASNGIEAIEIALQWGPDLILLDVMMPGGSGFDFLPTIRKMCDVPVIMLTALDEEDELVNGLDLGADDYITKPFSPKELVARLRAVNRRHSINKTDIKTVLDDLELFCNQSMARVNKVNIALTEVECHILHLLLNSKDHSVSRDLLYSQVLKRDMMPDDRSLDVHISNLRRKLGSHPTKGNRIRAIRGQGYALTK